MNLTLITALTAVALLATSALAAVDVKDFGAKGDGSVDDSAAIQKAMDAASEKGGGVVELGAGKFRLDKPISVPEGVTLSGVWQAPHHAQLNSGTVFEVYAGKGKEDDPPLITLNPSSCVKGITFFYPEQQIPNPHPYPYTIQGKGMHGSVIDCTFVNPYKAIDFGTFHNELHYIRNCFGCPLKVGIHVDQCSDIGRIENVHFNPHYWGRAGSVNVPDWQKLRDYIYDNLVGFEFGRSDWEYVHNTFVFGAKYGYRFYQSTGEGFRGVTNGNFLGIGADWCDRAIMVEKCEGIGLLITNGEFVGGDKAETMIETAPQNEGTVQFNNCSFWGPCEVVALLQGKGVTSFSQCNFINWMQQRTGKYTIEATDGNLTVENCQFKVNAPDIKLGENVKTAIIATSRFTASKDIDNQSKGDVQEGLNVVVK